MQTDDVSLITLDTDWAPDAAIDFTAQLLLAQRVRATWFITHNSPAIERLKDYPDCFELGIHPNFMAGSTHGATPAAVLRHCLDLVPAPRCVRTHGLVQSTALLDLMFTTTPVVCDVSVLLPRAPHLQPVKWEWHGQPYWRVPYFWEDDVEMERAEPDWNLAPLLAIPGMKVFDFHPIHVMLNSADMAPYEDLKRAVPRLTEATAADVAARAHAGPGSRTVFAALVAHLAAGGESLTLAQVLDRHAGV